MEAVLLSITPSFVVTLEKEGRRCGKLLSSFKKNVDRPLAAILSLNTISHTVGAAGVGAQVISLFGSASLGAASAILTFLILVFSEIIPKTLGARYWRSLAPSVAYGLVGLIWVMYPFVLLSQGITLLITGKSKARDLSREEVKALADLGERAGLFRDREYSILRNLFRFPTLQVKDIMTPRPVVFALEANQTVEEALEAHPDIPFSRIPLYLKSIDSIIGFALRDDLASARAQGNGASSLMPFKREILTVPSSLPLSSFLDSLLDGRAHIAVVIDEYGGTDGIVTMEDAVETLLGMEIVDEEDTTVDMQAHAKARWKKRSEILGLPAKKS